MNNNPQLSNHCKIIDQDNVLYLINDDEKTAGIYKCNSKNDELIIPKSINHESKQYIIKRILSKSFEKSTIKSIKFSPDSELQTIETDSFLTSSIKRISIPSQLIELENGWCRCTEQLIKIEISPENKRYILYDKKMIFGKSSIEQNNYDLLVFCVRNAKNVIIPSFIEHICPCAFYDCSSLQRVNFKDNSKLQTIGEAAFCFASQILSFTFPQQVKQIGNYAFSRCSNLQKIEFFKNSKLKKIGTCAFYNTKITSINFPSELTELEDEWCRDTLYLTKISVSPSNPRYCCLDEKVIIGKSSIDQENYDCLVFCVRNAQKVLIPDFIEYICPNAFCDCQVQQVEFGENSKLQTFGIHSFECSSLISIKIPSSVKRICEDAFSICEDLCEIEIPIDSKLEIIEKNAFSHTTIDIIFIPSQLVELQEEWCSYTPKLTNFIISQDNQRYLNYENIFIIGKSSIDQTKYDQLEFCIRDIRIAIIPNFIERICSRAFSNCMKLHLIEFENNSKLKSIGKDAFSYSSIEKITIPSQVKCISQRAFYYCIYLQKISFELNSNLQIIENNSFSFSFIKSLEIPSTVKKINKAFINDILEIIEIGDCSNVDSIINDILEDVTNVIIMISVNSIDQSNLASI